MDPNLFVTMGRELRQLKRMYPEDHALQWNTDNMMRQMCNYVQTQDPDERAALEKAYMANLKWLAEWKRSKLVVVR